MRKIDFEEVKEAIEVFYERVTFPDMLPNAYALLKKGKRVAGETRKRE